MKTKDSRHISTRLQERLHSEKALVNNEAYHEYKRLRDILAAQGLTKKSSYNIDPIDLLGKNLNTLNKID
jgi:hypothetical protein